MQSTTNQPVFDVRQSAASRAVLRLFIVPLVSIVLIAWGISLVPPDYTLWFSLGHLSRWDTWGFFGLIMIGTGVFNLVKEAVFACRSLGTSGEWHFRLADGQLTWDVPQHAHGKETGFRAKLSEIKEIEFRTIQRHDEMDQREYWIHFHDRDPIELQSHAGVSLSWLVSKLSDAGVVYKKTHIDK